jgi:anti-sigma B factor antagonist
MEIQLNQVGSVAVVKIDSDQIDASNARDFKDHINPISADNRHIVFDLSAVRFVDSSGLGAILSYLRRQHEQGGDLKLAGMTKPVRMLFELVRMHRIFEIYNNVEEAVGAFVRPESKAALSAA